LSLQISYIYIKERNGFCCVCTVIVYKSGVMIVSGLCGWYGCTINVVLFIVCS